MPFLQHGLELLLGEAAADRIDRFGGVKIEMNLSKPQWNPPFRACSPLYNSLPGGAADSEETDL
jgi:hypothetical protein